MKYLLTSFLLLALVTMGYGQEITKVKGTIVNGSNDESLENVNIVNLNQVVGTSTDEEGVFEIAAQVNDTLHLSYLGFKSIRIRVTNDWFKYGKTTIKLTELALALEEVVVFQSKLTGFLEVDIKQIPIRSNNRFSVSGLPNQGYEAGSRSGVNKVLSSIFNPTDFLYNIFGNKPRELGKLRKMKEDDEIRNLLASRFDREMLLVLLEVDRFDLDEIVSQCNYSRDFIVTANDLQILDAISECYEEYKVLSRKRKNKM
ncbi:carboxypeptidase-like regulatory domain-containing protein [Paucihalobacter sp.]|uniref:carboxypeptidase-like regulatory domain-containing protein n=1 Tax=Paucihalobacter sp. TaxID=2850405 RepID=UPI002FE04C4A